MMRRLTVFLATIAFLAGLLVVHAHSQQREKLRPNDVKDFMRVKLKHAQNVLEGLTMEDYAKIEKSAQDLSLLSLESNWRVLQTPDYLASSSEFRRTTQRMRDAAKNKNLDGATLAYAEMTVKCVNCHKHVRRVKMAKAIKKPKSKKTSAGR